MLTPVEKDTIQRVIYVLLQLADDADNSKASDIILGDIVTLRGIIKKSNGEAV